MTEIFKVEILEMLSPKIKSVLRQTPAQYREDLEQELKLLVLKKINIGFNETPSFFKLLKKEFEK